MVTDTPPQADEEDLVAVAAERDTLEGFLEYHRRVLGGKRRGLSEEDARRRLVPSPTTLLGLVRHAAAVERNWFQHYLGGKPREEITGNARGDAPSWDVGADQTVPHDQLSQVSLRFIYMNIISEHARHAGHADILREQI